MARLKSSLRPTETYTEPNFLRVYMAAGPAARGLCVATIEHLSYSATKGTGRSGWTCSTIVDGESMTKEDALFIARSYAIEHEVPVIYESHAD